MIFFSRSHLSQRGVLFLISMLPIITHIANSPLSFPVPCHRLLPHPETFPHDMYMPGARTWPRFSANWRRQVRDEDFCRFLPFPPNLFFIRMNIVPFVKPYLIALLSSWASPVNDVEKGVEITPSSNMCTCPKASHGRITDATPWGRSTGQNKSTPPKSRALEPHTHN